MLGILRLNQMFVDRSLVLVRHCCLEDVMVSIDVMLSTNYRIDEVVVEARRCKRCSRQKQNMATNELGSVT